MRSLPEIQSDNRRHAINNSIDAIREHLIDISNKGVWASAELEDADKAIVRDGEELHSADRQYNNVKLYNALVELIGKAKANGWPQEQLQKADLLVTSIERAATGRTLENGVPAGFKFAA